MWSSARRRWGRRRHQAGAHIRPVGHNRPDITNNGVALSGTAHWMFDRGLICFTDELEMVISRHVNDRDGAEGLINRTGRLIGPELGRDRPSGVSGMAPGELFQDVGCACQFWRCSRKFTYLLHYPSAGHYARVESFYAVLSSLPCQQLVDPTRRQLRSGMRVPLHL